MLRRAVQDPTVHGGEWSMAQYLYRIDKGDRQFVGLPIFPLRNFTARDVQERLKKEGLPWTLAKARRGFAAVGPFAAAALPQTLTLTVNGETRQKGSTQDMLFDVPKLLAYLDETFGLAEGDLVFTGTPPGVGPLKAGDRIEASLGTVSRLRLTAA